MKMVQPISTKEPAKQALHSK